jgi:hypothetical protein
MKAGCMPKRQEIIIEWNMRFFQLEITGIFFYWEKKKKGVFFCFYKKEGLGMEEA